MSVSKETHFQHSMAKLQYLLVSAQLLVAMLALSQCSQEYTFSYSYYIVRDSVAMHQTACVEHTHQLSQSEMYLLHQPKDNKLSAIWSL